MFKLGDCDLHDASLVGFNLLSEILFVQAGVGGEFQAGLDEFQSLERDSVCSSQPEFDPAAGQ